MKNQLIFFLASCALLGCSELSAQDLFPCDGDTLIFLSLDDDISGGLAQSFRAFSEIIASNEIVGNADISFFAADRILLKDGFHVENGSSFIAQIEECDTDSVVNAEETILAKQLFLNAFPNPASSSVEIQYELKNASDISLHLFNATGQRIEAVANEKRQPAGIHRLEIDVSQKPSGIYFYELQVENLRFTKKLIVSK